MMSEGGASYITYHLMDRHEKSSDSTPTHPKPQTNQSERFYSQPASFAQQLTSLNALQKSRNSIKSIF